MAEKKKNSTKIAAIALAAALLVGGGTYAYLQASTDEVENQFNPNNITVDLKETENNIYEIIPGTDAEKDPTVTVNTSVDAYVFVDVTDETFAGGKDGQNLVDWAIANGWSILEGDKDDAFVLYREANVDKTGEVQEFSFPVIQDNKITFSTAIENEDMSDWMDSSKFMTFQAYAIQKASFDSAEAAWAQVKSTASVSATEEVVAGEDTTVTATLDGETYSVVVPADAKLNGEALDEGSALKLTVTPGEPDANLTVKASQSEVTYDVKLFVVKGAEETQVESSDKPILVSLDIGVVDLVSFYHNNTEYANKVDSLDAVKNIGDFYAKINNDKVTVYFLTETFSPFTSVVKFGGGVGTEEYPYIIATRGHMEAISEEYADYNYFKVADGYKSMDCTEWNPIYLNGSFDGNGIKFQNVDNALFRCVGFLGDKYDISTWLTEDAYVKNFDVTFKIEGALDMAQAMARQVFGNNTTTFENVKIHGNIVAGSHTAAFFSFASGNPNDYKIEGFKQAVEVNNCLVDANIVCPGGGAAVVCAYPQYCTDIKVTINNPDTIWKGTALTGTGKICLLNTMYPYGGELAEGSTPYAVYDCDKITANNPAKADDGYTVAKAANAARMEVYVAGQLTETDENGKDTAVTGITLAFEDVGSIDVADVQTNAAVKVYDKVNSVTLTPKQAEYSAKLNGGVLACTAASDANYTKGTVKLTVTQYDANGNMVAAGTLVLAQATTPNDWVVK